MGKTERERQTDRETDRQRQTDRQTETERDREGEGDRDEERERYLKITKRIPGGSNAFIGQTARQPNLK